MSKRSEARKQFLADVLSTAIEGGINYWAAVDFDSAERVECEQDALGWRYGSVRILDKVDGTEFGTMRTIDANTVARGLRELRKTDRYSFKDLRKADRTNGDEGDFDAGDADAVIQLGIFGEIVYG